MLPSSCCKRHCGGVGCFSAALAVAGHCLATEYFIHKLLAARWAWVILGYDKGDHRPTKLLQDVQLNWGAFDHVSHAPN